MDNEISTIDLETEHTMYAPYVPIFKMGTAGVKIKLGYRDEWVIDVPFYLHNEIIAWCNECFGTPGRSRKYRWRRNYLQVNDSIYRIFLRNKSDVTLFVLRWS